MANHDDEKPRPAALGVPRSSSSASILRRPLTRPAPPDERDQGSDDEDAAPPPAMTAEEEAMIEQLMAASLGNTSTLPTGQDEWIPDQEDASRRSSSKLFGAAGASWKRSISTAAARAPEPAAAVSLPARRPASEPVALPSRRPPTPEPAPLPEPPRRSPPTSASADDFDLIDDQDVFPDPSSHGLDDDDDDSDLLSPPRRGRDEREDLFDELLSLDGGLDDLGEAAPHEHADPDNYGMIDFDEAPMALSPFDPPPRNAAAQERRDPYALDDLSPVPLAIPPSRDDPYDPYALDPDYSGISGTDDRVPSAMSLELDVDDYDLDDDLALANEKDELDAYLPDDFSDGGLDDSHDLDPVNEPKGSEHHYPREVERPPRAENPALASTAYGDDFDSFGPASYEEPSRSPDGQGPRSQDGQGPRSIDAASVDFAVSEALDDALGERLVAFEAHLLKRLERRTEGVVKSQEIAQIAALPADWGTRSPQSRSTTTSEGQRRLNFFLDLMKRRNADGLHFHVGAAPMLRVGDKIEGLRFRTIREQDWQRCIQPVCPPGKWPQFEGTGDVDFIYETDKGRYHVSLFRQRKGGGAVFKRIPDTTMDFKALGLPDHLERLADLPGGLCLFCGPYGSGTSTTIAALIDLINQRHAHRIITLEDPIGFVHVPQKAIIHQREIGVHARSFSEAMIAVQRENPNVVVIGELLDKETTRLALEAARAGILVFAVLHELTARAAIQHLLQLFPENERPRTLNRIADTLRTIVCQQLMPRKTGNVSPAIEVLINTFATSRLIREGDLDGLNTLIDQSDDLGMIRMDRSLASLVERQVISEESAMARAVDPAHLHRLLYPEIARPVAPEDDDEFDESVDESAEDAAKDPQDA